ncbi:MAG TPA: hypothetical protein VGI39_16805 [Polyangiaceae bacterium]
MKPKSTRKKPASKTAAASKPRAPGVMPAPPITGATVAQCTVLLDQVAGLLGPVQTLSGDEIRRMLKLRKGGAQVIGDVADLCNKHGVTSVGPVSVQAMTDQWARATGLNQIGVEFRAVEKSLDDATVTAESAAWQCATALYTTLQRMAKVDPVLAQGLGPLTSFFQTRRTKGTKRETQVVGKAREANKRAEKYAPKPSAPVTSSAAPGPAPANVAVGSNAAAAVSSPAASTTAGGTSASPAAPATAAAPAASPAAATAPSNGTAAAAPVATPAH